MIVQLGLKSSANGELVVWVVGGLDSDWIPENEGIAIPKGNPRIPNHQPPIYH